MSAGNSSEPLDVLLRRFHRISQDIDAALQQESVYNQRLALRAVEDRLDGLLQELDRSTRPHNKRFISVVDQWHHIATEHIHQLTNTTEKLQEIDNPYVIGVPLTEQRELFVGRTDTSARIEQLLLDRRRPPLLLYGQRRTGKTSLLYNLGRLLPSTIVPLFVDLQGPVSLASDHVGFLSNLAQGMIQSAERYRNLKFPQLTREELTSDPFSYFDEWLDKVEYVLGSNTALLALDEFEALDTALARGRFEETVVLGMLRHLIQHRPRFKISIAGSHSLDVVQRWASNLINVQV
ncbi:MAG: ATP-binding protein, partial [Candidatus Binatia bacterium]